MLFTFCGRAGGAESRRRRAATQPAAPFNVGSIPGEINGNFPVVETMSFQAPGNIEGGGWLRCGSFGRKGMKIKFPIIYTAGGLRFLKRLLAWCDSLYTCSRYRVPQPMLLTYIAFTSATTAALATVWRGPGPKHLAASSCPRRGGVGNATQ